MTCGGRTPTRDRVRWLILGIIGLLVSCSGGKGREAAIPSALLDIQHYQLSLHLDPQTGYMQATAWIDVVHPEADTSLVFAFEELIVDSVRVDKKHVVFEQTETALTVHLDGGQTEQISQQTRSQFEITYHGKTQLGYEAATHDGHPVYFTDTWPNRGRGWLPGIHHPADPATFGLLLHVPLGYEAVAAGELVGCDTLDSTVQYEWRLNEPVPTYTFAFAVADFSTIIDTTGATPIWYAMLASDVERVTQLSRTPTAFRFFEERIGPYPYAEYGSVQVPIGYAGMENATAVFLQADLFHRNAAEETQVHELAHQWFGNDVVIADWNELWLSEGFATYLTTLFYEHIDGSDAARQRWVEMASVSTIQARLRDPLVPDAGRPPGDYLSWVPYNKGASVLHLLRMKVGDEAFFRSLRTIYEQHKSVPLTTPAVQTHFEAIAGVDLASFFSFWMYGTTLPQLSTKWNRSTGTLTWTIQDDDGTLDDIPFELAVQQGADVRYVNVRDGALMLNKGATPIVQPVGVMMHVRSE